MRLLLLLLFFLLELFILPINSLVNVNISRTAYSWVVNFKINGAQYINVVDTGNYVIVNTNESYYQTTANKLNTNTYCSALILDGTYLAYYPSKLAPCYTNNHSVISIGSAVGEGVSYIQAQNTTIQNPILHDWDETTGDLGLSYNFDELELTAFQQILLNSTQTPNENQTFGLDFRDPVSPIPSIAKGNSSLQLGGISSEFVDSITWLSQAVQYPDSHEFFLEDLSFCGNNLFRNFSNNWLTMVDTGSSCLTLPAEMYDSFSSWFNNNSRIDSLADLPAISFKLSGSNGNPLYIPLGILAVQDNAIMTEQGAPFVTVNGNSQSQRICVLKGGSIKNSQGSLITPPPLITFGSLVLQSLYFGANFNKASVGFANKLSKAELLFYANNSNPSCAKPASCTGQQSYSPGTNECQDPECERFFFMTLDKGTHTCVYTNASIGFGLFFIALISLLEVSSFFVSQYTAQRISETRTTSYYHVDSFTSYVGKYLASWMDALVNFMSTLDPIPPPPNNNRNNNNNFIPMMQVPMNPNNNNIPNQNNNNNNNNNNPARQRVHQV